VIGSRRHSAARSLESGPAAPSAATVPAALSIWLALGALYVIWGSTYLAIRVAVRTIPPFLMAGVRFMVAGGLMYAWAVRRGDREGDRPRGRQWVAATVIGGFLLLGGNGGVVWAEQHIPSGIAALLIATVPLWLALLDRVAFGNRLPFQALAGLALGFGGLVLLVEAHTGGRLNMAGLLVLIMASILWATGSLYARRAPLPDRPLVGTGMEMLAGGALLTVVGLARGELGQLDVSAISGESLWGLLFLIVFGSWIGFSSYVWLLRVAPVSLVGTYAYVNPVVAVLLGWAILSEAVTGRTLLAGAIIVLGVALIILARPGSSGDPAEGTPVGDLIRRLRARLPGRGNGPLPEEATAGSRPAASDER
jgi:drug/metabolite transporter (DMT)-like permease